MMNPEKAHRDEKTRLFYIKLFAQEYLKNFFFIISLPKKNNGTKKCAFRYILMYNNTSYCIFSKGR